MIVTFFRWLWDCLLRFFLPPPPKPVIRKVDPNAPCVFCGNTQGSVQVIELPDKNPGILHTCQVCKGKWIEPVVLRIRNVGIVPQAPENEKPGPQKVA